MGGLGNDQHRVWGEKVGKKNGREYILKNPHVAKLVKILNVMLRGMNFFLRK